MTESKTFPRRLLQGYTAFRRGRLPIEQSRYAELAETGQRPEIMIIGCSDSRVSPEVIFDAGPGELFVVRNVANLVPPYAPDETTHGISAAIEFAVQALCVRHIVILGHARCGGIRAFAEKNSPLSPGDFIGKWIALVEPAAKKAGPRNSDDPAAYLERLEKTSVLAALENLMTFPFVREAAQSGRLALHAAYFDVATGALSLGDRQTGEFRFADAGAGFAQTDGSVSPPN